MKRPLLTLNGISKQFFGVDVLRDVSFAVQAAEALGLVGENGAGKSTLMNIIGGNLQPNAGDMRFADQSYCPHSPRDAQRAGIAFIHQELNLFTNLSIAENLAISHFPRKFGLIQHGKLLSRAKQLMEQVGLEHSPHALVAKLSPGECQLVEIAKALGMDARLIILDEPTTSLTARETQRLFALLDRLRVQGMAFIYISHTLDDVFRLCEQVVVLRDGKVVDHAPARELDEPRLISRMVGREIDQLFPVRHVEPLSQVLLAVQGVYRAGVLRDISFDLRSGEVLGMAGLMGSGRTELARCLFGLDPIDGGALKLDNEQVEHLSARQRIDRGLALLTESRRRDGLCMSASIRDNFSLPSGPKFAGRLLGWIQAGRQLAAINAMRDKVRLTRSADLGRPVRTLSGGNQQKVVLGKWLLNDPQVLILDEPTRGIDVGAKFEVYALINELAEAGSGILLISSEIEELIGMCDRILIMNEGAIERQFLRDEFDREAMLRTMLRGSRQLESV